MNLLPEQVGLAAYRIAEEALTNVVKHAKASKVTVRLDSSREGWLRLTVRDDGQGFDVESPPHGLGMGTMQDYAEAVDGECSVHSDPGAGTEVTAVLPLSPPGAEQSQSSEKGDTLMEMLKESCPWCHKEVKVEAGRERRYTCSNCQEGVHLHPRSRWSPRRSHQPSQSGK